MTPSNKKTPLYFDCDTGIDDALALAYLLAEQERIDLVGVGSVCGNIDAPQGALNTSQLLALAGRTDVPVAIGEQNYLTRTYACYVQHIHGHNGIGDITLPALTPNFANQSAPEMIVALARQYPGALHILATGPLTNIARAIQLEPELNSLLGGITIMGGAASVPGNQTPVAEANILGDPEAADIVFSALNKIVLVPLDLTMEHTFEESDRSALLQGGPLARALGEMLPIYLDFYKDIYGRRCCALHDPAAAIFAVDGLDQCLAPSVKVLIDATQGPGRGQTICDLRGRFNGYPAQPDANCRVVLKTERNLARELLEKILPL